MRILTYNIHKGFSIANRRYILHDLRTAIKELDCHFVFLQEVVGENLLHARKLPNWHNETQSDILGCEQWPHRVYGKNAVHMQGHHGNAILSKEDLIFWENLDISTNRFEQRGMLHAIAKSSLLQTEIHLVCLHLDLLERGRRKQINHVCQKIVTTVPTNKPLLIAGDFNDWRQQVSLTLEKKLGVQEAHHSLHGEYAKTFPSFLPALRLDRIYLRGLKPISCQPLTGTPWSQLSDHCPVILELSPA